MMTKIKNKRLIILFLCVVIFNFIPDQLIADEHLDIHQHNAYDLTKVQVISVQEVDNTSRIITVKDLKTKEEIEVLHYYSEHPADIRPETGDYLLLYKQANPDGGYTYYVTSYLRERAFLALGLLFVILVLLVGRLQGVKALISLAIVGLFIWKLFIPFIITGINPIWAAILTSCFSTIFTMFIVGGINRKSVAAIIGTTGGLVCAGLIAVWAGKLAYLSGFSDDYVSIIKFSGDFNIDPKGLLFAAIIIGALGAIMDVGMAISSAVTEVKRNNPGLTFKELTISGMNVGRDIMGTMTNTLILAYVGTSLALILLFLNYNISLTRVLNLDMIATEYVRMLAGSIGLVFTVPISAVVSGYLLSRK